MNDLFSRNIALLDQLIAALMEKGGPLAGRIEGLSVPDFGPLAAHDVHPITGWRILPLRLSPHFYQTSDEADQLAFLMVAFRRRFHEHLLGTGLPAHHLGTPEDADRRDREERIAACAEAFDAYRRGWDPEDRPEIERPWTARTVFKAMWESGDAELHERAKDLVAVWFPQGSVGWVGGSMTPTEPVPQRFIDRT